MPEHPELSSPDADVRSYVLLDVFAQRPLAGNPLAVFPRAEGLSRAQMQTAARELNLSETVFLELGEDGAAARIFTPTAELPFAGHPVLGAAFVASRLLERRSIAIATERATVGVSVDAGIAEMVQPLPAKVSAPDAPRIFDALGVNGSLVAPAGYENGPSHAFLILRDVASLEALRPDMPGLASLGPWLITCAALTDGGVATRTFLPALGVDEDPATGSAAGPLAVHLCRQQMHPWGEWLQIHQGAGLGRPSLIEARADGGPDGVDQVCVRGAVQLVGEGRLLVGDPST